MVLPGSSSTRSNRRWKPSAVFVISVARVAVKFLRSDSQPAAWQAITLTCTCVLPIRGCEKWSNHWSPHCALLRLLSLVTVARSRRRLKNSKTDTHALPRFATFPSWWPVQAYRGYNNLLTKNRKEKRENESGYT